MSDDETFTQEEVDVLTALGDRFSDLIQDRTLHDVIGEEFRMSTGVFLKAAAERVLRGEQDIFVTLLIATCWGMFLAEQGASKLGSSLTQLN